MATQRRSGGGGGRGRRGEYSRKYTPRRKVCAFCVDKISDIDYKDVPRLRRYLSERSKIEPRRRTGNCARHQRALAVALKRARHVALLPYTAEHIRVSGMVLRSPEDRRRPDDRGRRPVGAPVAAPEAEGAAPEGAAAAGDAAPAEGAPAAASAPALEGAVAGEAATPTDGAAPPEEAGATAPAAETPPPATEAPAPLEEIAAATDESPEAAPTETRAPATAGGE